MRVLLTLGALALTACGPPPVEPAGRGRLALELAVSGATAGPGGLDLGDLVVADFTLQVAELVFDGVGERGAISVTNGAPASVDLVAGTSDPELGVELEAGRYADAGLDLELEERDVAPALAMQGTQAGVRFRLEMDSPEVFEADAAELVVTADTERTATIEFHVAVWFDGIDLSVADRDGAGVVVLNERVNADLFDVIADRIVISTGGTIPADEI